MLWTKRSGPRHGDDDDLHAERLAGTSLSHAGDTAITFQMPVATDTPNAGHAIRLNRRATVLGRRARASQPRNESGQRQLTADPDGCGGDMDEEPDRVPGDR